MSKRRLSIRYKNLVDYIESKSKSKSKSLTDFLTDVIEEDHKFPDKDNKLWRILEDIYTTPFLSESEFGESIKTIIDIYNNNYELEEPKYYWKFKELRGFARHDLYFGTTFDDEPLLVDISNGGTAEECIKSELNKYLSDTELTADNFTPVEEIEND